MNLKILIATHNQGKLREYQSIFADLPVQWVSLADVGITWDVAETGDTFEANARLKAEGYCAATQWVTLADDSGLEVDALNGAPGVLSARYAGPHATSAERNQLLLKHIVDVPPGRRQARFRCVIAIAAPAQPTRIADGVCAGEIALEPHGNGGFGYDPLFYLPDYGCTMAELPIAEKNRISHRGRAAEAARSILQELIG